MLNRGRRYIEVDLKCGEGVDLILRLIERADALMRASVQE